MRWFCWAAVLFAVAAVAFHIVQRADWKAVESRQDSTVAALTDSARSADARARLLRDSAEASSRRVGALRDTVERQRGFLEAERALAREREVTFADSLESVLEPTHLSWLYRLQEADAVEDSAYEAEIDQLEVLTDSVTADRNRWRQAAEREREAKLLWQARSDTLLDQRDYWRDEARGFEFALELPFGLTLKPGATCGATTNADLGCAAGLTFSF